jgi:hypothetical protein
MRSLDQTAEPWLRHELPRKIGMRPDEHIARSARGKGDFKSAPQAAFASQRILIFRDSERNEPMNAIKRRC